MLRLMIFVSILNQVYGLTNITSQPAKVRNGDFIKLICDVGTMKNTVELVYDGVTYFSCDPPYTNCYTNTRITNDGYYDFSINDDLLIALFRVKVNHNDGTWSCYHGKEKADLEIDIADAARISGFSVPRTVKPRIQCNVESETPVDVVISVESYKEKKIIYDVKQSSLSDHFVETSLQCSDGRIYCNITNGYGPIVSRYSSVHYNNLDCPLKILYDVPYNTDVILNAPTYIENSINPTHSRYKIVYFVGYPQPSMSLYRIGADGIPKVDERNKIYPSYEYPTGTEPASIYIYTSNPENVKTGKYILILKQGNITEIVFLNIEKSTKDASNTDTRTPENDMDKTTDMDNTTDVDKTTGMDKTTDMDKTINMETNMMLYLGVAAFVMTLVLVLILVIGGVFWCIRIKRKRTGPVDKNQDYSIPVHNPNNESDRTYEELDKL